MKNTKILKMITILIMGVILFAMSINVFALDDSDSGLDFIDQSSELNTNTNTNTNNSAVDLTNQLNTTTPTNTNTTNSSNYNTSLPKAGAPENTMMVVGITILGITAVYAYKKVKEYKNI